MKKFLEVTDGFPHHVYILNDDKSRAIGYIKEGSSKIEMFKNPMRFYQKGRKFKEVK